MNSNWKSVSAAGPTRKKRVGFGLYGKAWAGRPRVK